MKKPKELSREQLAGIITGVITEMVERTEEPINMGYRVSQVLDAIEGVEF